MESADLRAEGVTIGGQSRTKVAVCYLEGVTNPEFVAALRARLAAIPVADGLTAAVIQGYLCDQPWSVFPLARTTQRPDTAARALIAGKVLVISDNDPFIISLPSTVVDFYQTEQDYQFQFWESSYVRVVRLIGWLIGLYLPATYIALTSVDPPPALCSSWPPAARPCPFRRSSRC